MDNITTTNRQTGEIEEEYHPIISHDSLMTSLRRTCGNNLRGRETLEIGKAMGWQVSLRDTAEGPHASYRVLVCDKHLR